MVWPVKLRGWRTIHIDDQDFKWRFDGTLDVLASPQGQRLRVNWPPARPGWELDTAPSEPFIITPRFVRLAIEFALKTGWLPNASGKTFSVNYTHPTFSLMTQDSENPVEP